LKQKQRIERLKHVLTVELAEPGVFTDDEGGEVFIGEDYRWEWLKDARAMGQTGS
jgi:hypothetical protein